MKEEFGLTAESRVVELIDSVNRSWHNNLINNVFTDPIAQMIRATPLSRISTNDRWIWCWSKNGVYNVKSGYYVAESLLFEQGHGERGISNSWARIWESNLPPKVRFFIWHLCNGAVASKAGLIRRGVAVDPICETCGDQSEDLGHIFEECRWSRDLWSLFPSIVLPGRMGGFTDWLGDIFSTLNHNDIRLFFIVCWWIWRNKNKCIFDGECAWSLRYKCQIMDWIYMQSMLDCEKYIRCEQQREVPTILKWKAPPDGYFKVNFDASFNNVTLESFYGCVVRDHNGKLVEASCGYSGVVESSLHAESLAARRAMEVVRRLGVHLCFVEGDNLILMLELKSSVPCFLRCGTIIEEIRTRAAELPNFNSFEHIRREGNKVAHVLASLYLFHSVFNCNNLPPLVEMAVRLDSSIC